MNEGGGGNKEREREREREREGERQHNTLYHQDTEQNLHFW